MLIRLSVLEKDTLNRMINSLETVLDYVKVVDTYKDDDYKLKYCLAETRNIIYLVVDNYIRAVAFNKEGLRIVDKIDKAMGYGLLRKEFCEFSSKYLIEIYRNPYEFDKYPYDVLLDLWKQYSDSIDKQLEDMRYLRSKGGNVASYSASFQR